VRNKGITDYPYQVYDRYGKLVLSAPKSCRYTPETELGLLRHGYTIRLDGRKITKKELMHSAT
jgi:hypothetical protein